MAYLFDIPLATDQLSVSQGNLRGNFNALGAIAGNTNPGTFSLNNTAGFNWVMLPNNGVIPPTGSAFPAGNVALYGSVNATTTFNELYINKTTSAGVVQIPATASYAALVAGNPTGWTYLPSGIKMVWGVGRIIAGGVLAVLYSSVAGFPGFSVGAVPLLTRLNPAPAFPVNNFVSLGSYSATGFQAQSSAQGNNVDFTWFAIGL